VRLDFAVEHAESVREIELNPLIAAGRSADDLVAVDALIVLEPDLAEAPVREAEAAREHTR
jgi:hypothetical protein